MPKLEEIKKGVLRLYGTYALLAAVVAFVLGRDV